MEERAGDQCREAIERALTYQPDNPEALQLMASYLFSTEKNQEGKEYLMRSVDAWLPALKQSEAPPSREDIEEEHTQSDIPPYESRITTAKLLIEAEEYEESETIELEMRMKIVSRLTAFTTITTRWKQQITGEQEMQDKITQI
ncbi:unnamed protein product [Oncorhynchus mykiss]|uniref:Uncharacterized protein n=1 Tax=Oncorhynchus mykiss TaxID=8022 RepID=A0A060YC41_ONCMY|nr:unnamed protein product [Oncorhynchus mykiss]